MFRAIFLPMMLMGMVGGPMLYSHHKHYTANHSQTEIIADATLGSAANPMPPWQTAAYPAISSTPVNQAASSRSPLPNQATQLSSPYVNSVQPRSFVTVSNASSAPASLPQPITSTSSAESLSANYQPSSSWNQPGMTPDYAKAETLVFPGDANGPDLTAAPMSFVPTMDLSSLFRFDITKNWITSRWDRVSTSPADRGLHGMRVALVTGTNSWDLHGSLTYFFDANHRVQRITYRGWTGDASRLLQILQQQHSLRPQPTHWAGLYLSKRSGLLMKHPAVIDKSNPVQQLAMVLEINNPQGNTSLSEDFQTLLPAAMATQ
jgi:hypothetical protein